MTLLVCCFAAATLEWFRPLPCGARPFTPTAYANCGEMQGNAPVKDAVPTAKANNVPVRDALFIICNMPDVSPAAGATLIVQRLTCAGALWI